MNRRSTSGRNEAAQGLRLLGIWAGLALASAPLLPSNAQEGLGLDLTGDAGPDLRPGLAVLLISSAREDTDLAGALNSRLLSAAQRQTEFNPVLPPEQTRQALADANAEATHCADVRCLDTIANAIGVERLLFARLSRDGKRLKLGLFAFARGQSDIESIELEATGVSGLQRKLKTALPSLLSKISTPLSLLKVTTNLSGATIALGDRELGQGSLEKPVPPGKYVLHVTASEYAPYESEITLQSGGKLEVEANLAELPSPPQHTQVASSLTEPPPNVTHAKTSGGSLWSRPPLYVALAGLAALGVGLGLGASAQGVGNQVHGGGSGVLPVTRAQVLAAQQNAQLANILMGTGGAVAAGGALWFFLTPTPAAPVPSPSISQLQPTGLQLVATGTF